MLHVKLNYNMFFKLIAFKAKSGEILKNIKSHLAYSLLKINPNE